MRRYRIYSLLDRREYEDIEVDEGKIKEVLDQTRSNWGKIKELAEKVGLGIKGFKTILFFDPEKATFQVETITNQTKFEYSYKYPVLEINGLYDYPTTLADEILDYIYEVPELKKFIRENNIDITNTTGEKLSKILPEEIKSKVWEEMLMNYLKEEIQDSIPKAEEVLSWLDENFERIDNDKTLIKINKDNTNSVSRDR